MGGIGEQIYAGLLSKAAPHQHQDMILTVVIIALISLLVATEPDQ